MSILASKKFLLAQENELLLRQRSEYTNSLSAVYLFLWPMRLAAQYVTYYIFALHDKLGRVVVRYILKSVNLLTMGILAQQKIRKVFANWKNIQNYSSVTVCCRKHYDIFLFRDLGL
jgi:hypothetical protein